jgi:DNA polymerase-3 subunit delta'
MRLTPAEGGWRVAVIDAADEMNRNAANAVLKILEEPPARAALLLVAHAPGRLLPTIRSRCRRLDLHPLPEATVAALMGDYLPDVAAAERAALARLADGSVGRALELARAGGLDLYRGMVELLAGLPALDVAAAHAFADRVARRGEEGDSDYRTVVFLLDWWLTSLIRHGAAGDGPTPLVAREAGLRERLLAAAGLDRWMQVWEKVAHLFARADAVNLDRKQVVLGSFLALQAVTR